MFLSTLQRYEIISIAFKKYRKNLQKNGKSCTFATIMKRTQDDYYIESKRIRSEVLQMADALKEQPLRFTITNGITMDVEITNNIFKPYAIIDEHTFGVGADELNK